MNTYITIKFKLENLSSLAIQGPVRLTLPQTGHIRGETYDVPGATLLRLRVWTERREAAGNPNQFSMDGLEENKNART